MIPFLPPVSSFSQPGDVSNLWLSFLCVTHSMTKNPFDPFVPVFFFFLFVVDFVIHWNETAMGLHVFICFYMCVYMGLHVPVF